MPPSSCISSSDADLTQPMCNPLTHDTTCNQQIQACNSFSSGHWSKLHRKTEGITNITSAQHLPEEILRPALGFPLGIPMCKISVYRAKSDSLKQNGMELNEWEEEDVNDSGFGSGGLTSYKPRFDCDNELVKLDQNLQEISQCHFYYGSCSSQEARSILKKKSVGTFLLRDSSDSRYLYSLSLKTERGATSVRILYTDGLFQFDSDERIRHRLPRFESVLALIDFHVMISQDGNNKAWRWEEHSGKKNMTVNLKEPLKHCVPTLAHISRVTINKCLEDVYMPQLSVDRLLIPAELKNYLKDYPYRV
ncbi:suppressor of cytokine signaling 2-like [Physella acuta]|uniref:suppressor of cytokine signaling 2-like n=1 Tax=Physella acuta TaxID=109671 RepID=UPI0027DC8823|nr:suppressor of cytokine signaling 2-like [Physella acuta]XP_059146382.1 suppressor of cytokine signaling 2-like [Physella acuta]